MLVLPNLCFSWVQNKYACGDVGPLLMNKNSLGGVSQAHPAPVQISVPPRLHATRVLVNH